MSSIDPQDEKVGTCSFCETEDVPVVTYNINARDKADYCEVCKRLYIPNRSNELYSLTRNLAVLTRILLEEIRKT